MENKLKSTVMQDFRDALGVNGAPSSFEDQTPIVPVSIVGGNLGLPRPKANQRLRHVEMQISGGASTDYQLATNTRTTKVYFVGCKIETNAATATGVTIWDADSGAAPAFTVNTVINDTFYVFASIPATSGINKDYIIPMPSACSRGIRINAGGAGVGLIVQVWYLEELIE